MPVEYDTFMKGTHRFVTVTSNQYVGNALSIPELVLTQVQLNILVNSKNRAIITDFGSAHAIDSAKEAALSGVNTAIVAKIKSRTLTGVRDSEPLKADIAESGEFITMTGPAWTIRWAALSCWMEIFPVWGVISGLLGGFVGR